MSHYYKGQKASPLSIPSVVLKKTLLNFKVLHNGRYCPIKRLARTVETRVEESSGNVDLKNFKSLFHEVGCGNNWGGMGNFFFLRRIV